MAKAVRLRHLTKRELRVLRGKLRDLSLSLQIHQGYRIIEELRRGRALQDAAEPVVCHFTVAYDWVRRFNEISFGTFALVPNPKGRPPILRAEQLRDLVDMALFSPSERGLPVTVWSVARLAEYCRTKHWPPKVTDEWARRLLRREGLSAERFRCW